jgi:3-hexulose-6-phosphate synthase/6-phospho-3-hexuloisomerase
MEPVLQVALDLVNAHRAIQIAQEAAEGGVDWLEAGTPLIKSEGMTIVRDLARLGKPVVADMKTMDVGTIEVEMAAKAGAEVVCVLGLASDTTLKESIATAHRYGVRLMVDLIGVEDAPGRAKEMESMGADYVCVHISIDDQMVGKQPFATLQEVAQHIAIPIAAAGGINSETAHTAVANGASIIIVGGAIVKAEQVCQAAKSIKQAILDGKSIATPLFKKYSAENVREAFEKVSTGNICDAMHNQGAMRGIHPLQPGWRVVGPALTVHTLNGDWAKVVEAIDSATPGSVVVVQAGPGNRAVWGELATWSSAKKGLAGVVIDGAVRDVNDIRKLDVPVFARHLVAEAGEPKGYGEIGAQITCGGQQVKQGDWIIGDDSGVVVVPKEQSQEIANRALNVHERENRLREEIKRGSSLGKVLELKKWEKHRYIP